VTAHLLRQHQTSRAGFPYGLYHLTASGATNWHEYASHVIERARMAGAPVRVAPAAVLPITTADYPAPAQRPLNSRLANIKLQETFGFRLPDWREGVDHILEQILRASSLPRAARGSSLRAGLAPVCIRQLCASANSCYRYSTNP